ncbi:hypothetical protein AAMO2058_001364300 [Amorphochlora amoebiformis]
MIPQRTTSMDAALIEELYEGLLRVDARLNIVLANLDPEKMALLFDTSSIVYKLMLRIHNHTELFTQASSQLGSEQELLFVGPTATSLQLSSPIYPYCCCEAGRACVYHARERDHYEVDNTPDDLRLEIMPPEGPVQHPDGVTISYEAGIRLMGEGGECSRQSTNHSLVATAHNGWVFTPRCYICGGPPRVIREDMAYGIVLTENKRRVLCPGILGSLFPTSKDRKMRDGCDDEGERVCAEDGNTPGDWVHPANPANRQDTTASGTQSLDGKDEKIRDCIASQETANPCEKVTPLLEKNYQNLKCSDRNSLRLKRKLERKAVDVKPRNWKRSKLVI